MLYSLQEIDKKLKSNNQPLSEKFIGIRGKFKADNGRFYIVDDDERRLRLSSKITASNISKLEGEEFFFGFVNEYHEIGQKHLEKRRYADGLKEAVFNPFLDNMEDFLRDQMKKRGKDVKGYLKRLWARKSIPEVVVVCPQNGRVYEDLKTGINFKREDKQLESRFKLEKFNIPFYQLKETNKTEQLLRDFINRLDEIDRQKKNLIIVIRGGSDLDLPSIFNKPGAYAAIASMQTRTACAVGHTNEHMDFKQYCDYHEQTPSLLGVTLGDWAEFATAK